MSDALRHRALPSSRNVEEAVRLAKATPGPCTDGWRKLTM